MPIVVLIYWRIIAIIASYIIKFTIMKLGKLQDYPLYVIFFMRNIYKNDYNIRKLHFRERSTKRINISLSNSPVSEIDVTMTSNYLKLNESKQSVIALPEKTTTKIKWQKEKVKRLFGWQIPRKHFVYKK